MSRIGKQPIPVPKGVTVTVSGRQVKASGPKGTLSLELEPLVSAELDAVEVRVVRENDEKRARAMHGLFRNLVANMLTGVAEGFTRTLLLNGVGYRAEIQGKWLVLNVGYSQPVNFAIPDAITVAVESNTKITVSGCDKQQVGQVAAHIREIRPPEPYKGKGIRYENEHIRRKAGKSAAGDKA